MTPPELDPDVGGDGNQPEASDAAKAFEDLAEEMIGPDEPEEEEEEEGEPPEDGEPTPDELEGQEEEADSLAPPNSLKAEEKAIYEALPDDAKAFVKRRIGELERGFHAKAQEASNAREAARMDALMFAEQIRTEAAQRLEYYANQLTGQRPPDARLMATDPTAYAYQLEIYENSKRAGDQAMREAQQAATEAQRYAGEIATRQQQEFNLRLQSELPEVYDPENGTAFVTDLAATLAEMGSDLGEVSSATIEELKALKIAASWRAKAAKYDKAMASRTQRVDQKKAPAIARPGTPKGQPTRARRTDAAWEAVRNARTGDGRNAALADWAEAAGFL